MRALWYHPIRRLSMQTAGDAILLASAYIGAFHLRFSGEPTAAFLTAAETTVGPVVACTLLGLAAFRVYRMMWRYLSLSDLIRLAKGLLLGVMMATLMLAIWTRFEGIPRSVVPIYALFGLVMLSAIRMVGRSWFEGSLRLRDRPGEATRVLLIGAGRAAELLLNELRANRGSNLEVVGLLDDDAVKHGRNIHGAPVLGGIADLGTVVRNEEVESVVFCIPSAPNALRFRVLETCSDLGLTLETLPRLADLAEGKVTVNQIRRVTLEDLLGRDPVALDERAVADFLNAKVVLITGAGGSIGSEICRQVMAYGPACVLLFERSELALFTIDGQLRRQFPSAQIVPVLGDVQDPKRLDEVLRHHAPQVVFHAAAYKHVPLVETNPFEALSNNVGGTLELAKAAAAHGVDRFVLISTDKAVNPTSFMGATKRVAEQICMAMGEVAPRTRYTAVRFGNVIGSSGSVVPTFREQIERGGPITVTHPEIERFFMTIPEAAQLVLQASTLSEGDETFILEMGSPVRIVDLARQMIRLSGLRENEDISIKFTGLRPGEKLYEELMLDSENLDATRHSKIMRVRCQKSDATTLLEGVDRLLEAGVERNHDAIGSSLELLVDNYRPTTLPRGLG